MAHDLTLEQEQAAFDSQLDSLLEKHAGEFVLMRNGRAEDFFQNHESAYEAALDRFGPDATFLIARVEKTRPTPVSISWAAGVMFE